MVWLALLATLPSPAPPDPIEFGRSEIASQAGARATDIDITVHPNGKREEYAINRQGGRVRIVGSDANGAMYGALEFAERLHNEGEKAWTGPKIEGRPYLPDRGLNLFLTLPWNYTKNDTDYDVAALTDPNRWWFHNEDYWRTLLDLMARSRLNWLDIHGTWDISSTGAPNLYAYFVTSKSFPLVGVPPEVKAKDLAQLNHVIDMAHARGIRVSLMAYEANLRVPQNPRPPYAENEANAYRYTREVVEAMIRGVPKLDAIGFRIGESGHGESFFNCYGEAVKASGRDIPLITRSWITTKQRVLPLARSSKDFTVEVKYNGEQWGAPYPVMGGRMANWGSYSFQDYFSDSGAPRENAKTWDGWPAEGGGRWPSQPYKVVWQVRANGTHRIFPFYNPNWVRRSILAMKMGTVSGYTIEGMDAYFPKSPDYYLANPDLKYCVWIHQRDELYWMTWGRLGYDPTVPDEIFDRHAIALLPSHAEKLLEAWKKSSLFVPRAYMGFALGPDHRDHAPELEWGGNRDTFIHTGGLDTASIGPPDELAANVATNGLDGRLTADENLAGESLFTYALSDLMDSFEGLHDAPLSNQELRAKEVFDTTMLEALLASYYGYRIADARGSAIISQSNRRDSTPTLPNGETQMSAANASFERFAAVASTRYKPFTDRLRMHTNNFSWASQEPLIATEAQRVLALPQLPLTSDLKKKISAPSTKLSWQPKLNRIQCTVTGSHIERAWLLVKPLPSSTFFHKIEMHRKQADRFECDFERERWGHVIAAEVVENGKASRVLDPRVETPYLVIPSQPGPTPQIYDAGDAPAFFDPSHIDPTKYGGILVGCRAAQFLRQSNATKRKLLDPVKRGMRLVILQEDFIQHKLDWFPRPLAVQRRGSDVFDPAGAYDLPIVNRPGILFQTFVPSPGWEILGKGGLARLSYGRGEILVTTARVMQFMQYADAAKAFVRFLSLGGKDKPTILVDSCSEGAAMTSSCHPDLMNSHGIPFLTLGEVIAKEQGMNSFSPVPGPVAWNDVLEGKGTQIANAFLRGQVQRMAKRPNPSTINEFEPERARRKRELLRTLGLDPMPPKTPLNARITGRIQRDGFHIEKLVFESRPRFYVTAHVYVPDHPTAAKLPVIVHVNGHWAHKKDEDRIQLRCAFCALQGYIAIALDSPGHSFEGNALIERRAEGEHNDFELVEGGTCATGYYVWDAIRALDYMATRPDTDMSRVGITGASGGGLATLYAFAADDRYKAAVPVVYMASLELAPDNGCLCNHVPGTCQIGDRSDVLAIQAPKPVYIMGAEQDGEFPPDATRLTHQKLQPTWSLFGRQSDTYVQIFAGGHDYNQPMREAMIGFFNRYLKGDGDGKPVPQPPLQAIDPENRELLAADPPIRNERTMRDLSREYLDHAPANVSREDAIAVNGGMPVRTPLNYHESNQGSTRIVTFESEPGFVTPGVLVLPTGDVKGVRIIASDGGKAQEILPASLPGAEGTKYFRLRSLGPALPSELASATATVDVSSERTLSMAGEGVSLAEAGAVAGIATLYLDILGTGELHDFEMRYPVYLGKSPAFIGGWQIVRAAEAMKKYSSNVEVVGKGTLSSQAAMWAGILDPTLGKVTGLGCQKEWQDAFEPNFPDSAVQPRAHLLGSLDHLRRLVQNSHWQF